MLEDAFNGWLDLLRKEAARRADRIRSGRTSPRGFKAAAWPSRPASVSSRAIAPFQSGVADEVERTARDIYEELEKNPVVLNTLRGSKFALDVAAIGRHRARPAASAGRTSSSCRWSPRSRTSSSSCSASSSGHPARADAPAAAGIARAVALGAAGGVADAVAGDRRLGVRAAATGAGPHPRRPCSNSTPACRRSLEELRRCP